MGSENLDDEFCPWKSSLKWTIGPLSSRDTSPHNKFMIKYSILYVSILILKCNKMLKYSIGLNARCITAEAI